jgi:hypothetical protein
MANMKNSKSHCKQEVQLSQLLLEEIILYLIYGFGMVTWNFYSCISEIVDGMVFWINESIYNYLFKIYTHFVS